MTALPLPNARTQFIDADGAPLVGGQVFTYIPGTMTGKTTWQDTDQTILNTNPIVLDDLGSAAIWAVGAIRQIVYDALGNLIWDQVTSNVLDRVAAKDLSNATYLAPFTGAVSRGAISKLADWVSVKDFGAIGDGVTDDGPALTAALATGFNVLIPDTSASYNFGTASFTIGTGQFLFGEGMVHVKSQATTYFLGLAGYIEESGVSGLVIDMTGAGAASSAIRFLNGSAVVYGTTIAHMRFDNCYNAIGDEGSAHYIADNRFYDIKTRYQKGPDVLLRFTQGFQRWDYINFDYTWSAAGAYLQTWVAFTYSKFAGIQMNECFHTGQSAVAATPAYIAGCGGFDFVGSAPPFNAFIWGRLVRSESSQGFGVRFTSINFINLEQCGAFTPLGFGLKFDSCNFVNVLDLSARGSFGQAASAANVHGVIFTQCFNVSGVNLNLNINNGSGLLLDSTSDATFTNIQSSDNTRYGIEETGTSARNTYAFTNMVTNTLASVSPNISAAAATSRWAPKPVGLAYDQTWSGAQNLTQSLRVNSLPVVGSRVTGFTAMTGTATKTAFATYNAPTASVAYVQAEMQAVMDALQAVSRRLKADDDALLNHGLIGA